MANNEFGHGRLEQPAFSKEGIQRFLQQNIAGNEGFNRFASNDPGTDGVFGRPLVPGVNLGDAQAARNMVASNPKAEKVFQDFEQALLTGDGNKLDKVMHEIDKFNKDPEMQKAIMDALNADPAIRAKFPNIQIALSGDWKKMLISGAGPQLDGSYGWGGHWKKYEPTPEEMNAINQEAAANAGGGDGGGGGGGGNTGGGGGW